MNCDGVRKKMQPFIEGKLEPREFREMIPHIRSCASCQEDMGLMLLREELLSENDPGDFHYNMDLYAEEILRDREKELREEQKKLYFGIGVAVFVLLAFFTLLIFHRIFV